MSEEDYKGWVYIIKYKDKVKIGKTSKAPKKRVRQIECASGIEDIKWKAWKTIGYSLCEKYLHKRYKEYRMRNGEWFSNGEYIFEDLIEYMDKWKSTFEDVDEYNI